MKKKFLSLLAIVFAMLMLGGCSLFSGDNLQREVLTVSEQEARIQTISETYVDAVVTIFTYQIASDNYTSLGSGVVIKDNGFIATNFHVISTVVYDGLNNYELKVAFNDSAYDFPASIEWYNIALDLAIIKVDLFGLDFVPMKDRSITVTEEEHYYASEFVIAIGTPIDFSLQNTVTVGRISSKAHRITYVDGNVYEDLIQHTAPINHGNSGGGLFDLDGNLIALNTLGNDDANSLFFAVPIYPIIEVLDQVVSAYNSNTTHRAGLLGITAIDRYQVAQENDIDFEESGMLVLSVDEAGASFGKLFKDDIIKQVTINGNQTTIDIRNNFVFSLLKTTQGTSITLKVQRNSSLINITITLD